MVSIVALLGLIGAPAPLIAMPTPVLYVPWGIALIQTVQGGF